MDTHEKFIQHLEVLAGMKYTMPAIAEKTNIDYHRLRNIKNPHNSTKATDDELTTLEKAYRSELLLDYSEEDKQLIEELRKTVEVLSAQKDGYKKMVDALSSIIEKDPSIGEWEEVKQILEGIKSLK